MQTLPANNYHVAAVSQHFVLGAPVDASVHDSLFMFSNGDETSGFNYSTPFEREWLEPMRARPANLTVRDCILNYSNAFPLRVQRPGARHGLK